MPTLNKNKYEQSLLFFTKNCNNKYLGETKLNKLMYYLDFISFRDRNQSVTQDQYIHKDFGPVPQKIDEILSNLKSERKLSISYIPYKNHHTTEFKALVEPDLTFFDDYELKLLENICKKFELWSTDKIVAQTHLEAPWFYSKPYDVVDYNYSNDLEHFQD